MKLSARMPASEALREVGRALGAASREYWPSIAAAAVVAAAALGLFAALRAQEDAAIHRTLDLEGRLLPAVTARGLEAEVQDLLAAARRWEGVERPDSAAWAADMAEFASHHPLDLGFEWRERDFGLRWAAPLAERLPGGVLDGAQDAARANAASTVAAHPQGSVAATFIGSGGNRSIVFAAPMLRNGERVGAMIAVARARAVLDTLLLPEVRRGFSIAVREGPYRVYGAFAPNEGDRAADWWSTTRVQLGDLQWSIDYWPAPELLDRMRSRAAPLVLVFGLVLAAAMAGLTRVAQLASRAAAPGRG